jgi:hypothetical protein
MVEAILNPEFFNRTVATVNVIKFFKKIDITFGTVLELPNYRMGSCPTTYCRISKR